MKKQEKLLHSSEKKRKKKKKGTIKSKLIIKRKESVIKFEQDKTSLNKIWPPTFFCCMFICNYCESEKTVC